MKYSAGGAVASDSGFNAGSVSSTMPLEKLGPYKLERLLGRGGMGAVYLGLDEQTGERAAVKLLSEHLADDGAFRERFKTEIETLKRLLHPNIVRITAEGEENGHLYYVMELVNGRSLQDELTAGRRFTWREVARIGVAVSSALKHAHDLGIIHRDLKPANLLLDANDQVKLTDFGIAKLYGGTNVTAEGGVLGTADYMAPEQAEGTQIDNRCDLYALGSVLYALLAGRPPFGGRSIVEVIGALKNEKPVPVRRWAPETPLEFEKIIQQLLEKDPPKRIPTALAVANRLKAMEHALSLDTRVVGPQEEADASELTLPDDAFPSSAKTASVNPASHPTLPLEDATGEYRLAADAPTSVTGDDVHSSRTKLGTQAGKKTGVGHDSGTAATGATFAPKTEPAESTAKITRFTTVSEEELRGQREADEAALRQWILVGGMAAVAILAIAGMAFYATRPPSADRLYTAVKQAADSGGTEELIPVEGSLTRFLDLYPDDPRAAEVREHQEELERYRLQRRFELRARRTGGLEGLAPVERVYLEAVRLTATDPEAALAKFEALVAVYGSAPDSSGSAVKQRTSQQCLDLARQQIGQLRKSVQTGNAEQETAVRRQLERADQLAATDRAAAEKIWRGIITLYDGKAWAQELVEKARAKLAGP